MIQPDRSLDLRQVRSQRRHHGELRNLGGLELEAQDLDPALRPGGLGAQRAGEQAAELSRQLIVSARQSQACQILMSLPGVGAITATSFATAVEDPGNFRKSRSVGAWLGLTTRRYQSGEVDYDGHISRRGDTHLRGLLYEAATVVLTRTSAESSLRTWGLKLKERIGFKRAAVAVARKLAVVMHAMLRSGQLFDRTAGVAA
jgi:transposase